MKFNRNNVISLENEEKAITGHTYFYSNKIKTLKEIVENPTVKDVGVLHARFMDKKNSFLLNLPAGGVFIRDWSRFHGYKYLYPVKVNFELGN